MTLKETIRKQMIEATKAKQTVQKNVLKVVIGEIDTQESRNNKCFSDEETCKVIKKVLQGIEEMIGYRPELADLLTERDTLKALLPKELNEEDVKVALASKLESIKMAKSDGQATGIAMKHLKELNLIADGNLVKNLIINMRNNG